MMDTLFSVFGWLADHWDTLALVATTIAGLTPTTADDTVVGRVLNLGRTFLPPSSPLKPPPSN